MSAEIHAARAAMTSMADLAAMPLGRPCPVCGAAAGQPCRDWLAAPPEDDPVEPLVAPEDRQAMIEAELAVRQEADVARALTDQADAWALQLTAAAGAEGLDVVWLDQPDVLAARLPGRGHPVLAPRVAIDSQRLAGVPADAVAAMLKAVALEPRLAWWGDDDDLEDDPS
jgi:bacterioferritin-associated ferredoxin